MLTEHNSLYKKKHEKHVKIGQGFCTTLINTGEVEKDAMFFPISHTDTGIDRGKFTLPYQANDGGKDH